VYIIQHDSLTFDSFYENNFYIMADIIILKYIIQNDIGKFVKKTSPLCARED